MSFSYDSDPDSKDVINENAVKNNKKIRVLFWQEDFKDRKKHVELRDSGGGLLCPKCQSANRYGSRMNIGYDPESKSIVKKCDTCSNQQVLENGVNDNEEEENKENEISPGGGEKLQPLVCVTLDVAANRDRGGNRMPTGLSSNRGLDENTIRDITSTMGSSHSGGPTFNERMNWGRRKWLS